MEISRVEMLAAVERLPGSRYRCICDCGEERIVSIGHFNTGNVKSCGCHVARHGHSVDGKSREYTTYHNMVARCHKPSNKRYKDYGAKGIVVCQRWLDSFPAFLKDMGECPVGMQIDRIDNSRGYDPDNCRWVTPKENAANRSVTRVWTVVDTEYLAAEDAAAVHGVSAQTIRAWCQGRTAEGRYYPPKPGCSVRALGETHEILKQKGLL